MKKTIFNILMLFLVFTLVGCNNNNKNKNGKDDDEKEIITLSEVLTMVNKTKDEFLVAGKLNITLETEVNNKVANMKIDYEIDGFNIETFKYYSKINEEIYEAYIKDNVQYVNFNNSKSKSSLDQSLERKIISDYSFINLTTVFFNIHTNDFFNILKVDSEKDNIVNLSWDKNATNSEEVISYLKDEFSFVNDIDSIIVKVKYLDDDVVYIESFIVSGTEKVRLLLNFYADEFLYPTDLDSYSVQK